MNTIRQARPAATALPASGAHRRVVAALAAMALLLTALATGAVTARPAGASSIENTFTSKLNQERSSREVPRLTSRDDLVAVARAQAARMASRNRLYHNPDLTTDVSNWRSVGENVGYGPDAARVHTAFMHSPPHRANILDRDYTEVGIGVVTRSGRVWVAQVFRRPARASAAYASFTHTLRPGSTGAAVQRVQRRLGLSTTGYYGRATLRAVTRFQRALGWYGRGNVGPKTWGRLF